MLEGLAVWALFIYILRMAGMPWNKATKSFAYLGGTAWLLFVWVGLINYTPMDISGGSVVQSPRIQLRPQSPNVSGEVDQIFISPNQNLVAGEAIYHVDDTPYQIALAQAQSQLDNAKAAYSVALQEIAIAQADLRLVEQDVQTLDSQIAAAQVDLELQQTILLRYQRQNQRVADTITANDIDKQSSLVALAKQQLITLQSQRKSRLVEQQKGAASITKANMTSTARQADVIRAQGNVEKAQWDLDSTTVYAPSDGFVTNFILREGQRISMMPRLQMYTNEKYVLMRVNHQAIRNVKPGQAAEFASPVYPGKVFAAQVEGIVEATGESQPSLLGIDDNVRATTGRNAANKHHFVRLKIAEPDGYDLPVGAVGLAWISAEKPFEFMSFLDAIRGIIIRMKAQIYFFFSI